MNKLSLLFLSLILSITSVFSQDEVAKKILDQLSEKGKSYTDITANFSYNFSNSTQGIDENTEGKIWIKGEMYKLDMSENLSIINNGTTLWYIMKDIPEVQIMENDPEDEMNPSKIFTIYESGYKYQYNGAESVKGKRMHSINLYPNESGAISKVVLFIDAEKTELSVIQLHDKDGGVTTYSITKFTTNSSLSDDTFKFTKTDYPDIEVIDLR